MPSRRIRERKKANEYLLRATRYERRANSERDYVRRSPSTSEGMRVPEMSKGESMEDLMNQELNEAIATLNRANRAIDRLFNTEEREEEDE